MSSEQTGSVDWDAYRKAAEQWNKPVATGGYVASYPYSHPCPSCGHCPTCGRRNSWPQITWTSPTIGGNGTFMGSGGVSQPATLGLVPFYNGF